MRRGEERRGEERRGEERKERSKRRVSWIMRPHTLNGKAVWDVWGRLASKRNWAFIKRALPFGEWPQSKPISGKSLPPPD